MAKFTKHVGQILSTQERCIVVFRQVPNEPQNCLVVQTGDLNDDQHNDLINEVESVSAQQTTDLANHLNTRYFRDGGNMLQTLHSTRKLIKVPTNNVMMTPTPIDNMKLSELNDRLANLKDPLSGNYDDQNKEVNEVVSGDEVKPASVSEKTDGVLDDFDLAKNFITQADGMEAEAKRLREQAYDLIPKRKLTAMLKKENAPA